MSVNEGKEGKHSLLKLLHLYLKTSRNVCDQNKFSLIRQSDLIIFFPLKTHEIKYL